MMLRSFRISVPRERKVHGILIKKLPVGAYLSAAEELSALPGRLMQDLFPEQNFLQVLQSLGKADADLLCGYFLKACAVVPEDIFSFLERLLGCDGETLRFLTPLQLTEVLVAVWEENELGNFIKKVKGLVMSLREKRRVSEN